MKKYLFSFAVLMMGATLFTACSNDDDTPSVKPVDVSNGLLIVGSGNKKAGIGGNVSYIDYGKGMTIGNAFFAVNGKSVGKTANYITQYGSKLYIVVDGEATIWVCNKNTLKIISQISTTTLLGENEGRSPRAAVGLNGNLYFTCYGSSYDGGNGIVAVIDTVSFSKKATYVVGSYPDGLTIANNSIYVANSNYGGLGQLYPSISKIALSSGTVTEIKDDAIPNPMHMLTVNNEVYCLDYGTYDENWNQTGAGVRKIAADGKVTKIVDGTAMCTDGKIIYTVNTPYGSNVAQYFKYDVATGSKSEWQPKNILSPQLIAADPVTGNIFIVSLSEDEKGYPSYQLPTYTNQYDASGNLVNTYYNTATGAISFVFNTDKFVQE